MITLAPSSVDKERAAKAQEFITDETMPKEYRHFMVLLINKYSALHGWGETMAGSLAWSILCYMIARPDERDKMLARGEALRAQLEWEAEEIRAKRDREVWKYR